MGSQSQCQTVAVRFHISMHIYTLQYAKCKYSTHLRIDKFQDKVQNAAGKGGAVFGAGKDENKQDLGVTGTPANENLT